MVERRYKNTNWTIANEKGEPYSWESAAVAVLMDIRDELQQLNGLLNCQNFLSIPRRLERIARNTTKKKPAKKAKG